MLLLIAAVAAAGPTGKVVRIERPRANPKSAPLLCEVKGDLRGTCIGRTPKIGEIVMIVDETSVVAEVEIRKFDAYSSHCDVLWNITTDLRKGNVGTVSSHRVIGVADPTLSSSVRRVPESDVHGVTNSSDEKIITAIDRDGDSQPDIVLTAYRCDASGNASSTPTDDCIDIWSREQGKMKRTSQTRVAACGL